MNYWNNICEINRRQEEKGIKEYGQRLEDNKDFSIEECITYAEEEAVDLLKYLEHLKYLLRKMERNMIASDMKGETK